MGSLYRAMCRAAAASSASSSTSWPSRILHDRDDLVAPAFARSAGDHAVVDAGMRLDRRLDLLGEDLLAAGVDRHRVAAVQLDDAVLEKPSTIARARRIARRRRPGTCAPSWRRRRGSRARGGPSWPASRSRDRPARAPGRGRPTARRCPGVISNVPVVAPPPVDTCDTWPPASDEPSPSTIISVGRWARNSSFRLADSGAPPDSRTVSDDRS